MRLCIPCRPELQYCLSNSLEMLLPLVHETFTLFRSPESIQRGLRFSQVVPFLLCAFAARVWNGKDRLAKFAALRRACSPKMGAERFSRLIGNFDTTAKGSGWQVTLLCHTQQESESSTTPVSALGRSADPAKTE
jgi:hypothetical protein